jgi:branched-chain amino acid transport system substrate-binding protein
MSVLRFASGLIGAAALAILLTLDAAPARAQNEQFVPILIYRTGPYAFSATGFFGGMEDYMAMINARDGGVNGVKLTWEECETAYQNDRGVECYERLKAKGPTGATAVSPLSTGITYALIERATADKIPIISLGYGRTDSSDGRVFPYVFPLIVNWWSQETAIIQFIAQKEGGAASLKGKKIGDVYHDSPYGAETIPILKELSAKYGFELKLFPVTRPGVDQRANWLEIAAYKPDWVILRGWGVMNPVALREAAAVGFPANHIIGPWAAGSEEDVVPAGDAARGYYAAGFHGAGRDYKVIEEIIKEVHDKGRGNIELARVGSVFYNRGVVNGIVTVEAIRKAQERFGHKSLTGEQVRWGIENLSFDAKRIEELGARGLLPPFHVTCADHEGGGPLRILQWSGSRWLNASNWIATDQAMVRKMVEESAGKYAKEKDITLRNCKEETAAAQ